MKCEEDLPIKQRATVANDYGPVTPARLKIRTKMERNQCQTKLDRTDPEVKKWLGHLIQNIIQNKYPGKLPHLVLLRRLKPRKRAIPMLTPRSASLSSLRRFKDTCAFSSCGGFFAKLALLSKKGQVHQKLPRIFSLPYEATQGCLRGKVCRNLDIRLEESRQYAAESDTTAEGGSSLTRRPCKHILYERKSQHNKWTRHVTLYFLYRPLKRCVQLVQWGAQHDVDRERRTKAMYCDGDQQGNRQATGDSHDCKGMEKSIVGLYKLRGMQ